MIFENSFIQADGWRRGVFYVLLRLGFFVVLCAVQYIISSIFCSCFSYLPFIINISNHLFCACTLIFQPDFSSCSFMYARIHQGSFRFEAVMLRYFVHPNGRLILTTTIAVVYILWFDRFSKDFMSKRTSKKCSHFFTLRFVSIFLKLKNIFSFIFHGRFKKNPFIN